MEKYICRFNSLSDVFPESSCPLDCPFDCALAASQNEKTMIKWARKVKVKEAIAAC